MSELVVNWKGEEVKRKMEQAVRWGIDSTMADCVTTAKSLVRKKTTVLQGSIQMRPAQDVGGKITGYWGSFSVKYALWVEEGTQPHMIFPRLKKALYWKGADHPVRWVDHPGNKAYPYLVPAAERHYPSLGLRIQAKIAWGTK
jgi:hypothetical protein